MQTVVSAVLVRRDADLQEIMRELYLDPNNREDRHVILAAIGALVDQKKIAKAQYVNNYHWIGLNEKALS